LNNIFNPTGLNGIIPLAFTPDAGQCAAINATSIEVSPMTIPVIAGVPASICETNSPISLSTTQSGINGLWSGPGVLNNIFNPTGLNGTVALTFIPDQGQCADTNATAIIITPAPTPMISGTPNSICQTNTSISLPTIQSGINGNWSGTGVTNNFFNPSGLNGSILLTYSPDVSQCALVSSSNIFVEPAIIPSITGIPDSACQVQASFSLATLQSGITGTWTGPGVTGNNFYPSGLNGNISLTFTPATGQCANVASTSITITASFIPVISGIPVSICETASPVLLSGIQNNISGNWSGPGITSNIFNPAGLIGAYTLTFLPNAGQCANTATAPIVINTTPSFSNLAASCDSISQTYIVTFDITGGAPGSYTVNGNPVAGSGFISSPFDADSTDYIFLLDDGSGCGPVTIDGHLNCACATFAGTMNFTGTPLKICEGSPFSVFHNSDENLDSDDLLGFVIHDNAGTQLGTIYAISDSTIFDTPQGINFGQYYYLSSVAGTNNGTGSIDLNDACLSVSQGIPVIFNKSVESNITATLCPGEFMTVNGSVYDEVHPAGSEIVTGVSSNGCDSIVHVALSFYQPAMINVNKTLCSGESVMVNGVIYNQSHSTGTETILNGDIHGCDSTIIVQLSFYPAAAHQLNKTLCYGSSITINGTIYNESNPAGTEILLNQSSFGCDSIIIISLNFDSVAKENINSVLCPGESLMANNVIYNESNPIGTELFPNGSVYGCDSLVNISLSFYPPSQNDVHQIVCADESIIVNGTLYDTQHPSGFETLAGAGQHGCDSVMNISLSFYPPNQSDLRFTLCEGESVTVNGTVYNGQNPSGTETFQQADANGCDSIITIEILELPHPEVDAGPDQYIHLGENAALKAEATFPVASWSWSPIDFLSCTDCPDPVVVSPDRDIQYLLTISNADGCMAYDKVQLFVSAGDEIFMPTIFSPNGDGINDLITINATPKVQNITSLRFFDRWGGLISEMRNFSPNDPGYGWDGNFNGKAVNPGVYRWVAEVEFKEGQHKIFSGDV
ncbi:MAG: gliding motility-associated C-terminal domain-containing protein, partial [Saprospiraceae bacterium]